MGFEKEISDAISSRRYKFKDWKKEARDVLPHAACGVYLIWRGEGLLGIPTRKI